MLEGVLQVIALLAAAAAFGLVWRARNGRVVRVAPPATTTSDDDDGTVLGARDLGTPLGEHGTLVQFSAVTCASCAATGRVLADAARDRDGVTIVHLDVDENDSLVRRLRVLRTPTVVLLDGAGRVVARASGALRPAQALTLLESCPAPVAAR